MTQTQGEWKFDLTLFDGGAGAGDGGGEGGAGADAGVMEEAAAPAIPQNRQKRRNPLADVRYGKQPDAAAQGNGAQGNAGPESAPTEEEWKAAKERYKDFFGRDTSQIVKERFKNSKDAQATLDKLAPVMQGLGKKYGKDPTDIDGILAAYTDDDTLYEEEAAERGVPVSVYKQLKQLQADKDARDRQEAQTLQEQQYQRHIAGLVQQGEQMKATFPGFDLRQELENPQFRRLTSPEVGVSVSDAYWLIHRAELQGKAMQVTAQKVQQKLSQSMQNPRRPAENGARAVSPALDVRDDPSKWSRQDRDEVRRRVRNGERIVL